MSTDALTPAQEAHAVTAADPPKQPPKHGPDSLYMLMGVNQEKEAENRTRLVARVLWVAAIVNFVGTGPALLNSVLHHLFPDAIDDTIREAVDRTDPTQPFLLWIWLGFGLLWGVFFLQISVAPVLRREWLSFAIAEKLVTTLAVWGGYLILHDVSLVLPLVVLVTDLAFVFVFAWLRRVVDRLAAVAAHVPRARPFAVGSSPVARWLLRFVGLVTTVAATVVLVASLRATLDPGEKCGTSTTSSNECTLLASEALRSNFPFLVWIWAGMALVVAAAMLWAADDPVPRRAIIRFGVWGQLIPVLAVAIAQLSSEPSANPDNSFSAVVVGSGLAFALLLWIARRSARAASLVFGREPLDEVCPDR